MPSTYPPYAPEYRGELLSCRAPSASPNSRRNSNSLGTRQERVEWHQIVVFGKATESCKEYLKKGRQVYVEGRLHTYEFEARDNGGKPQRTEIVTQRVQCEARRRKRYENRR